MTDRDLEERLRAWYRAEVGENETAPPSLRRDVAAIPRTTPIPIRPLGGRRGLTLLAAAALLLVGGAVAAAGSGLLRLPSLVPPEPAPSSPLISSAPSPSAPSSVVPAMAPSWTATGSMRKPRGGHTATLLPDGKVLVAGGDGASAELYDPGAGSWTATGTMLTPRQGATATLLRDGKVLVAGGGRQMTELTILASAELYDPGTGSWTAAGTMGTPRAGHTATLLPDGKVLVAGGSNFSRTGIMAGNAVELAAAELYDPSTGSWTATGTMGTPRSGGTATLLPDGKVLVAGGYTDHSASASSSAYSSPSASAELYDPGSGTWTATGSLTTPRTGHTATLLPDGRVFVVGGSDPGSDQLAVPELYDPGSGTWTATGSMVTTGGGFTATLLLDGKVLVAGGAVTKAGGSGGAGLPTAEFLASAEMYDPGRGSWTATASMTAPRMGQTATLLPDGTVLVAGGSDNIALASAELYDPGGGTPPTSATSPSPSPFAAATGAPSPALAACGNPGAPAGSPGKPGWTLTGNMTTPRSQHTATLLRDGRVLVAGGAVGSAAELYDPVTRTWAATGSMTTPRTGHTATLLPDGKVLVAGGYVANDSFASAELYDPSSGTWTAAGSMVTGRRYHTATLLPDGKVLVAGGFGNGANLDVLASAELYDPRTGRWSATGSMVTPRVYHKAILLADGRVLLTSGINSGPEGGPTVADLYDPRNGTWTTTRKMVSPGQGDSATLLPDGKVLLAGGANGTSAELYDPRSGFWTKTGRMVTPRRYHTATLLPDGTVLVMGGEYETTPACSSAELYDPGSGTWTATSNMLAVRSHDTATLLADGTVLVAGGDDYGADTLASAEVYDPGSGQ